MLKRNWLAENPRARKRAERLTRNVAIRSSAVFRKQQHHLLIVTDFPAHDPHQLAAQLRQLYGQLVQAIEGNFAHRGGFQRLGRDRMGLGVHAGQAHQFAGQVEAGELFFAAIAQVEGLQGARAHRIDRIEGIALAKQEFTFFSTGGPV
nr:hypothetical protein GCM10020185_06350 [Pseudomonas brassicacearum subsp. brassicacearum]